MASKVNKRTLNAIKKNERRMRWREANLRRRARQTGNEQFAEEIVGAYGTKGYDYKYNQIKNGELSKAETSQYVRQLRNDLKKGVGLAKITETDEKPEIDFYTKQLGSKSLNEKVRNYEETYNENELEIDEQKNRLMDTVSRYYEDVGVASEEELDEATNVGAKMNYQRTQKEPTINPISTTPSAEGQAKKILRAEEVDRDYLNRIERFRERYVETLTYRVEDENDEFNTKEKQLQEIVDRINKMDVEEFAAAYESQLLENIDEWYYLEESSILEKVESGLNRVESVKEYSEREGLGKFRIEAKRVEKLKLTRKERNTLKNIVNKKKR